MSAILLKIDVFNKFLLCSSREFRRNFSGDISQRFLRDSSSISSRDFCTNCTRVTPGFYTRVLHGISPGIDLKSSPKISAELLCGDLCSVSELSHGDPPLSPSGIYQISSRNFSWSSSWDFSNSLSREYS